MVILTAALQKSPTEFIMLPNEVFALECRKRYEEQGLIVDKSNGQFAHCPLPKGMGEEGVYLLWGDHQHQGLLQSRDVGRKCYFNGDVKLWLDTFPEGFFELYEIYDEFNSGKHNPLFGPHTKERKKKISEALSGVPKTKEHRKKIGESRSGKCTGENNPNYGRTGKKHPMYGRTGALNPRSRAIIVIKPDGTKLHFVSSVEAARELGILRPSLCRHLKSGHVLTRRKWKGWQFLYA